LPVLEMKAPIQKIKYGRCRKTPSVRLMVESGIVLYSSPLTQNS
jgi:hypothetical protein